MINSQTAEINTPRRRPDQSQCIKLRLGMHLIGFLL
jgi:hypothetical protein